MDRPDKVGGIALSNGIVFFTPSNWAAGIRLDDGTIQTASGARGLTRTVESIGHSSLTRLAGIVAISPLLATVKRALPSAKMPFSAKGLIAASVASTLFGALIRSSTRIPGSIRELGSSAIGIGSALFVTSRSGALRYHGAEHKTVSAIRHAGDALTQDDIKSQSRIHERCGSNLAGVLLPLTVIVSIVLRGPAKRWPVIGLLGSLVSFLAATELFSWAVKNPQSRSAQVILMPGTMMQSLVTTQEPTDSEIEVSEAAIHRLIQCETRI